MVKRSEGTHRIRRTNVTKASSTFCRVFALVSMGTQSLLWKLLTSSCPSSIWICSERKDRKIKRSFVFRGSSSRKSNEENDMKLKPAEVLHPGQRGHPQVTRALLQTVFPRRTYCMLCKRSTSGMTLGYSRARIELSVTQVLFFIHKAKNLCITRRFFTVQ